MNNFIQFVLSELNGLLALLIFAGLFVALAIIVIYLIFNKIQTTIFTQHMGLFENN